MGFYGPFILLTEYEMQNMYYFSYLNKYLHLYKHFTRLRIMFARFLLLIKKNILHTSNKVLSLKMIWNFPLLNSESSIFVHLEALYPKKYMNKKFFKSIFLSE